MKRLENLSLNTYVEEAVVNSTLAAWERLVSGAAPNRPWGSLLHIGPYALVLGGT